LLHCFLVIARFSQDLVVQYCKLIGADNQGSRRSG
jgi:hypothetical protein